MTAIRSVKTTYAKLRWVDISIGAQFGKQGANRKKLKAIFT